jgi:hypothetical protein
MNNIKWEGDSICYAYGNQLPSAYEELTNTDLVKFISVHDFQLNEIRQGDYISASELDTEQKYNDAVDVFALFGYYRGGSYLQFKESSEQWADFVICGNDMSVWASRDEGKRKITYSQLMAIGKLKRAMIERDKSNLPEIPDSSKPKEDGNKYHRTIYGLCGTPVKVDVYRVSDAFPTGSAPIDHAVKKMLCAGLRGHKDKLTDIDNAIESLQAARLLLIQKGEL